MASVSCSATVPEAQYRADLLAQQKDYEKRLRRLQESQAEMRSLGEQSKSLEEQQKARLEGRVQRLELESAAKQVVIEQLVGSKSPPQVDRSLKRLKKSLRSVRGLGEIEIAGDELRVRIPADRLFEQASTRVKPDGEPLIREIAQVLRANALVFLRVLVATDAVGNPQEDRRLSANQGLAVVAALEAGGADASRVASVAQGRFAPVASNETREGREKNRRVDLVFRTLASDPFQSEESVKSE